MFLFNRLNNNRTLGIDIGSSTAKWIVLNTNKEQYVIENYGIENIPNFSDQENNAENEDIIINAIRTSLLPYKRKLANVVVSVPHSSVVVVKKTLLIDPSLQKEEIEQIIFMEIEKSVPYPISDIRYDYEMLPIINSNYTNVILTIARKKVVDKRVNIVNKAGLNVSVVDTEAFAIKRLLRYLVEQQKAINKKNFVVFDIGASTINMYVIQNLELMFSDEQLLGSRRLTNNIQDFYHLDFESAELVKRGQKKVDGYEQNVLYHFKEMLLSNIKRMLQTCLSIGGEITIDEIILIGGGTEIEGLNDYFSRELNIPVKDINAFHNMVFPDRNESNTISQDAKSLMVCLGLALRNKVV